MRKLVGSLTALMFLVSCSQNDVEESVQMSRKINFSSLNDKVLTRAANDSEQDYQVYATLKSSKTDPSSWFMVEQLEAGSISGVNKSSTDNMISGKKYYWPNVKDWNLTFYAYAPFDANIATLPQTPQSNFEFKYVVRTDDSNPDAQEDFTIATVQTFTAVPTGNNVHLQFKHMLTKIVIKDLQLSDELKKAGYAVAYKDGQKPSLSVTYTSGSIDIAAINPTWSELTGNKEGATLVQTTYEGGSTYYILPQEAGGTVMNLPIVITKDGQPVFDGDVKYVMEPDDIDNNQLLPGKNYGMTITITDTSSDGNGGNIFGPEITFSSEIADWNSVDVAN